MIAIHFSGWFQARLATDNDPFDERRGKLGWTFAFPGEPDLDRIIRFQNPAAPRSHGPAVNVAVDAVEIRRAAQANHPLISAPVELLDDAKFEGHDGAIAPSAHEPIAPFHIRTQGSGITIEAFDPMDLNDPSDVTRRGPNFFSGHALDVLALLNINNPAAYRQQRMNLLKADRAAETDPMRQAALDGRIDELKKGNIRVNSLGFKVIYDLGLQGPNSVADPSKTLGFVPSPNSSGEPNFGWMDGTPMLSAVFRRA